MDAVHAALDSGRPFVSVTGPVGIGRTTFLARLGEELSRRGVRVAATRLTRDGDAVPVGPCAVPEPLGPVAGAHRDPEIARRAAAGVAAGLLRRGPSALLIDDAQWLDQDSRAVLEALARRLAGTTAMCVCAVRTPAPTAWQLHEEGLLHAVRLRPMTAEEISRKLAAVLQAKPDNDLVELVRDQSRGIPAAVRDAIEMVRGNGSVRVVSGTAYLVPGAGPLVPPRDNEFVRAVRAAGPGALAAAKAVSMLAPFGADVPRLVAEVLDKTEQEAGALLESLRREGVLHRGRGGRSWRLLVPLAASAIAAGMGPFERRRIAATAVTEVWAGAARCADEDYLTDLVAEAGRLVDPRRALDTLLGKAKTRWLAAAVELTENRAERARVTHTHAAACHDNGDHERALRGAQLLLTDFADQLTPDAAQEVQLLAVSALKAVGDNESLLEIAELRRRWAGDQAQATVTRAFAYSMLDRWSDVRDLLDQAWDCWHTGNPTSAMVGDLLESLAALWTGDPDRFERGLAGRPHRHEQVSALLVIGDTTRAEKLLIDRDMPVERLPLDDRALFAALRGEVTLAVDLARRGIATGEIRGHGVGSAAMYHTVVDVLVSQGRLTAAREMLAAARETGPRLGHLLDIAAARLDRGLGENERAAARMRDCLATTAERGLVVGTDVVCSELADLALDAGDRQEALRCLAELERLAETMPTARTLVHARLVRAIVCGDRSAADDCLRLVRERGQPMEQAIVSSRLVLYGVGDPALLSPAYELLGELDALLYRSWFRNLMREHGVVVPGRQQTLEENERLLAVLAADGLTNKQLAMALRTSEKSVEGRLSRLFTRTGYRSRIELSAAIRDGEFQVRA